MCYRSALLCCLSIILGLFVVRVDSASAEKLADPPSPTTVDEALDLAERTLEYVEKSRALPELAKQLDSLKGQAARVDATSAPELLQAIKRLRREIILSHPVLDFETLLINKNPPTLYSHNCDQYLGRHSQKGPGLVLLRNWKSAAPEETVLLEGKMPSGAYNKPKLHWEGDRIVFAFCDHTQANKNERRYFLWECATDGSWTRQLTGNMDDIMQRWGERFTSVIEDNDPCYLPDGGIAFVSTRSQNYGRCHNGRYTPSLLLYRCEADGYGVRQLSWGEANETDPVVLHDGRIAYTRWEYINRNVTKFHMLWSTRPDGTASTNFYGNTTEAPWMISETSPVPNSDKVFALATGHHTYSTGCILRIDPTQGENHDEPVLRVTPEVQWFEAEPVTRSGCYSTPYALNEEMCLAAYSRHKIPGQGGHGINDYAIYLVDTLGGRELIYRDENVSCFSPTPMIARPTPQLLADRVVDRFEPGETDTSPESPAPGTLTIQDVHLCRYDTEGILKPGVVKAIRVNEMINQPAVLKNGGAQPSMIRHDVPKKILGTVPVHEDGSASFEVPSCKALQLQLLDKEGKAIMTMRSFVYLQPGESRACVGCHEPAGTSPSRSLTAALTTQPCGIIPPESSDYAGGFSYKKSVQPVWDRYCIECHGLSDDPKMSGGLDLTGAPEKSALPKGYMKSDAGLVPHSYNEMFNHAGLLSHALFKAESNSSVPYEYFAAQSGLLDYLDESHHGVQVDDASRRRVIDWLDLNSQAYGDFSWNRIETRQADPEGEAALRAFVRKHYDEKIAGQPYHTLVNVGRPEESRLQMLADSLDDDAKATLEKLIDASIAPLPYQDIAGTCGRGDKCVCRSCWVRESEAAYRESLEE